MAILQVERIGGLAGFGGAGAHIRSRGQIDTAELSAAELQAVDGLFSGGGAAGARQVPDGFQFRITRTTPRGTKTVVVAESAVPAKLAACVQDEFV